MDLWVGTNEEKEKKNTYTCIHTHKYFLIIPHLGNAKIKIIIIIITNTLKKKKNTYTQTHIYTHANNQFFGLKHTYLET